VLEAKNDDEAVLKLSERAWKMAFVHIGAEQWNRLRESVLDERVIVGFSSQGFPPTLPQGKHALTLRCLKKTIDLEAIDISTLAAVCGRENAIADFRAGLIPPSVRGLLAFEEPHRLKALHILLQGVLALWASDPGHSSFKQASEVLAVVSIPKLPRSIGMHMSVLWRVLGLEVEGMGGEEGDQRVRDQSKEIFIKGVASELGLRNLGEAPPAIAKLINDILASRGTDTIEPDVAVVGFKEIERFLCHV
jgi:hypothetical protein